MKSDTVLVDIIDSLQVNVQQSSSVVGSATAWGLEVSDWVTLGSGVLGVVLGFGVSAFSAKRIRRRDLTYAMHREFFGVEMGDVREAARARLPWIIDHSFRELDEDRANATANLPIWKMMRFYQRLAVMMEHNEIHRPSMPGLFGGTFIWWYEVYFKGATQNINWSMASHMEILHNEIKGQMRRQLQVERMKDLFRKRKQAPDLRSRWTEVWLKEGKEGRAKVIAERQALPNAQPLKIGFVAVLDDNNDRL
ncbi:MAG: hypothetical protein JNL05_10140 [Flavobacteriales bacterium]|nr:hypothetical protein [Flavobacteriales bacterium]